MRDLTTPPMEMTGDLKTRDGWLQALRTLGEDCGFHAPLGAHHSATYIDGGPQLLVIFADLAHLVGQEPAALDFAREDGWSVLLMLCHRSDWFRSDTIYSFMDRLVDQDFFEDFGPVLFTGAGPAGYAAAAYSVAAPGSRVLLFSPQATLETRRTPWDQRYPQARRLDFTSRYGYAPDMLDGAEAVTVIYDPQEVEDAMHAELFRRSHVELFPAAGSGRNPFVLAEELGLTADLTGAAMENKLDRVTFSRLWRARRRDPGYLKRLALRAMDAGQTERMKRICDFAVTQGHGGWFVRHSTPPAT